MQGGWEVEFVLGTDFSLVPICLEVAILRNAKILGGISDSHRVPFSLVYEVLEIHPGSQDFISIVS